jgi:hypothetical protein
VADPLEAMTMYEVFPDLHTRSDRAREILRKAHAVSPSPSLLRIEEQIRRGDGSSRQLASLIEGSPALAAHVLRTANSAFDAPIDQVSSLSRALAMLGDTGIRQVVLTSLVLSHRSGQRSPKEALASARLMGDAVLAAAICRSLAALTGICSSDEAFSAGLRDYNLPDGVGGASRERHTMSLSALVHASALIASELRSDHPDSDEATALAIDAALAAIGVKQVVWASRLEEVRDEYGSLLTLFRSMAAWLGSTASLRSKTWSPAVQLFPSLNAE